MRSYIPRGRPYDLISYPNIGVQRTDCIFYYECVEHTEIHQLVMGLNQAISFLQNIFFVVVVAHPSTKRAHPKQSTTSLNSPHDHNRKRQTHIDRQRPRVRINDHHSIKSVFR